MKGREFSAISPEVLATLRALGGQATLGDLVALTGLSRREVEAALDALLAADGAHVKVSEFGDVVYHSGELCGPRQAVLENARVGLGGRAPESRDPARAAWAAFDRKTLQLIRAREGVISLAELVEHTGLPLAEAQREMRRLGECYGGVPYPSLDGHVVYAFPELMTTALGAFPDREPRPAWVRFEDPIRASRCDRRRDALELVLNLVGLGLAITAPWLVLGAALTVMLLVAGASTAGLIVFGSNVLRALEQHPLFRFRHARSLRRFLLGHVVQSALAGKGVVSLQRAVRYLQARAGRRAVSCSATEAALRALAAEFDAPITELNGDLFFGFRNVKRQFLASHLVRRRMRLGKTASGETVFDTADSPLAAAGRELAAFDLMLREGRLELREEKS